MATNLCIESERPFTWKKQQHTAQSFSIFN